jgi:hypothetical protein
MIHFNNLEDRKLENEKSPLTIKINLSVLIHLSDVNPGFAGFLSMAVSPNIRGLL